MVRTRRHGKIPQAEPDTQLPQGRTCGDCGHARLCKNLLGVSWHAEAGQCDWSPSYFYPRLRDGRAEGLARRGAQ